MALQVFFFVPRHSNSFFAAELREIWEVWSAKPPASRTMFPMRGTRQVRLSEDGIGLELDHLPHFTPPELKGITPSLVVIEHNHLNDQQLKAGVYCRRAGWLWRKRATASVFREADASLGANRYMYSIEIKATSLKAAVALYGDLLAGTAVACVSWEGSAEE